MGEAFPLGSLIGRCVGGDRERETGEGGGEEGGRHSETQRHTQAERLCMCVCVHQAKC